MATRTALLVSPMVGFSCVPGFSCCRLLGCDQFFEPTHFAFTRFESELMELTGIAVQRSAGPTDGLAEPLTALLDLASPAFEDPHPRFCGGAAEEGEVNAETVVGVVLRPGVGDQFGEPLPTFRSDRKSTRLNSSH